MPDLYIVAAQPNPPGRDSSLPGHATNDKLNEEWLEFEARADRSLSGDELSHLTFNMYCQQTGSDLVMRFGSVSLRRGQKVRVHTGTGYDMWVGNTYHVYAGRKWFIWNNACGDRATLAYAGRVIDSAWYDPSPPAGELVRAQGTDKLVPRFGYAYRL